MVIELCITQLQRMLYHSDWKFCIRLEISEVFQMRLFESLFWMI